MKRPIPAPDRIALRAAYDAASAEALRLYAPGYATDEWREAVRAADEAWMRVQEGRA